MKNNSLCGLYYLKNPRFKQLFRIMRITTFLFLVCVFCSFAENTHSQNARVSINQRNISLDKILNEIESQTDYLFIYNNEVDVSRKVSIKAKEKPVVEVLNNLLAGSDVSYSMEGTHIVLTKNRGNETATLLQQTRKITGTIQDANGEPIVGANVVVKGTSNGIISDMDGNFSLEVESSAILQVSFVGYMTREIPVENKTAFTIKLVEDLKLLDEVVVVGYGIQKKSSMTAAITNVSTKELLNIPRPNIFSALQGRVAGLTINETSGEPDASPSIIIRGIGTIDGSTSPLILVDGVPTGTLNLIPVNDVESISILKDASAAAIYGARAANGVILVTTKQGKTDDKKPMIQVNSYVGFQTLAQFPKKLTAYEYATLVDEVHRNDGRSPVYSEKDLEMYKKGETDDFHGNTDWKKAVIKDVAPIYTNHLSVSGNSKLGNYYVSGEYISQSGLVKKVDEYDRLNLRANIISDITDRIQFRLSLIHI